MPCDINQYLNDPQAASGSWYPEQPAAPAQSSSVPGSTGNPPATAPTATGTAVAKAGRSRKGSTYHPTAPIASVSGVLAGSPATQGTMSNWLVNFWNNPFFIAIFLILLVWAVI